MIRLLTDAEGDGLWYVLHTKPRQEKILSQDLAARKIRHFLPMIVRVRHYGRRKIQIEEPLFPGYLFLRGNAEDTYVADRTHRVAQILTVSDQLRLQYDLRNIALALEKRAPLNPYPYLQSGTWVEVTSGPFQGVQGVVESQTGADRLVIGVEILGQAVSIQLNGASVHALDASAPTANPSYRRQAPQPADTFNGLSSAAGALRGTERLSS